jgi:hypothetical protein
MKPETLTGPQWHVLQHADMAPPHNTVGTRTRSAAVLARRGLITAYPLPDGRIAMLLTPAGFRMLFPRAPLPRYHLGGCETGWETGWRL